MLDDICPVQFIEGINEHEEAMDGEAINTRGRAGVAIEYVAKTSYSLKKLDIFLTEQAPVDGGKYKVALCLDHDNSPSDIVLSEGAWARKEIFGDWQEVELDKPVVVVCNKKYWLTIDLDKGSIGLPIAKEGKESALRFRGLKKWTTHDIFKTDRVMLRFYGRILPILS